MHILTWFRSQWDRVTGWGLVASGVLLLVLAIRGVGTTGIVSDQLSYMLSGGAGGLACLVLGVGLVVSAGLHDEWRKLDRVEAAVRASVEVVVDPVAHGNQRSTDRAAPDGSAGLIREGQGVGGRPASTPS